MTDWTVTPGYLWFDPRTEEFPDMPKMPSDPYLLTHRYLLAHARPSWSFPDVPDFYPLGYMNANQERSPTHARVDCMEIDNPQQPPECQPESFREQAHQMSEAGGRDEGRERAALRSLQQACGLAGETPPASVLDALLRSRTWVEQLHRAERVVRGDTLGVIDLLLFMSDLASDIAEQHIDTFGEAVIDQQAEPPTTVLNRAGSASRSLITARNRAPAWFGAVRSAIRSRGVPPTTSAIVGSIAPVLRTRLRRSASDTERLVDMADSVMGAVRSGTVPVLQPDGTIQQLDPCAPEVQPVGGASSPENGSVRPAETLNRPATP
ncbi:hypothetical protein FGB62_113g117 [Gracilaria domingensis]|nr:hypothetical protein FGB62_113g117 [Gracilaria domingensis]